MSSNNPMEYNFSVLKENIINTILVTDVSKKIKSVKGSTICVGSGGSRVVADFASVVLNIKNNCSVKVMEPRDVLYENLECYKNIFMCSYSGNNYGVDVLSSLKVKKYLFTYGDVDKNGYKRLKCNSDAQKEKSFISLGATMMPMSVLLSYSFKRDIYQLIEKMYDDVNKMEFNVKNPNLPFDIITGNDTSTCDVYLESTFIESGLGSVVRHSKYDFCHGRSTLAYTQKRNLIYLIGDRKELDDLLLKDLKNRYNDIIVLESNYKNVILNNYYLTLSALFFTKYLAELKGIDLSIVNYDKELCKKLYTYKGEM